MLAHLPILIAAGFLGGLGRRIAGGVLNQWTHRPDSDPLMGDTPARLIYSGMLAIAAALGGALWWQSLLMVPAVWIGTTTGNFHSIAMGRDKTSYWHDFAGMSLHAFLSAILPATVAMLPWSGSPNWLWLIGCTMLAAPLYSLGWIISGRNGNPHFPIGLRGGSELGEFFWGNACGIGIAMAFLP